MHVMSIRNYSGPGNYSSQYLIIDICPPVPQVSPLLPESDLTPSIELNFAKLLISRNYSPRFLEHLRKLFKNFTIISFGKKNEASVLWRSDRSHLIETGEVEKKLSPCEGIMKDPLVEYSSVLEYKFLP